MSQSFPVRREGTLFVPYDREEYSAILGTDAKPIRREPSGILGALWPFGSVAHSASPIQEANPVTAREPAFSPSEYVPPSFDMKSPVARVVVKLSNHIHGDFSKATGYKRRGEEVKVKFGCQKRRISLWRRAGAKIVAENYPRPHCTAEQLDVAFVLANEVPTYADRRLDNPGPFDYYGIGFYSWMQKSTVPHEHRRDLTPEQREARARVIVDGRKQQLDHADRLTADISRLLPELLDAVESALAELCA